VGLLDRLFPERARMREALAEARAEYDASLHARRQSRRAVAEEAEAINAGLDAALAEVVAAGAAIASVAPPPDLDSEDDEP